MKVRIAVLKKDLIDIMLLLEENKHLSKFDNCYTESKLKFRAENRRKAIKKLQHLTEISDAELNDLYWKKQYNGK